MIRKTLCFLSITLSVLAEDKTVFLGTFIGNYDQLTSPFLKTIEQLDYDKKKITLQINVLNNDPLVTQTVKKWEKQNQGKYSQILCVYEQLDNRLDASLLYLHPQKRFSLLGKIKNDFLQKTKEFHLDYCFIIDSDVFLAPFSLKELMAKEKPVITPVLRPIPEVNDPHCNFLSTTNDKGFQNYDYDFFARKEESAFYLNSFDVVDRISFGTMPIVSAFGAYLIQSNYIDNLTFKDSILSEDFFAFARSVKKNNLEHFVCNEREFGSFLHFQKPLSRKEEKTFYLTGAEIDINKTYIEKILSPYCEQDFDLKNYQATFLSSPYSLYRVENRDLFYVDEKPDVIKTHYIKRGKPWEKYVREVLENHTKPGTIAIDIGGHMGTHTLSFSKFVGDTGTVHVFEPQPKLFSELVVNMSLNSRKNIVFHRMALGNECKEVFLSSPCSSNEGMCRVTFSSTQDIKSPMEKLDNFQLSNVSIIKIDVEGFEKEVIEGSKETILKNKPVLLIEISGLDDELKGKKQLIEQLGYSLFFLGDEDYLCLPKKI